MERPASWNMERLCIFPLPQLYWIGQQQYSSDRTQPDATMKTVDVPSAWFHYWDLNKNESGGWDPLEEVEPYAHRGVVGIHHNYCMSLPHDKMCTHIDQPYILYTIFLSTTRPTNDMTAAG